MKVLLATRLHLGKASVPPSTEKIQGWIRNWYSLVQSARESDLTVQGIIAVDATPKLKDYDFVEAVETEMKAILGDDAPTGDLVPILQVLPVTPWGKFVPALNALVTKAHEEEAEAILFGSAEISASSKTIQTLCDKLLRCTTDSQNSDVLVVGAALPGHLYKGSENASSIDAKSERTALNGRTCPWNTLAVWNVNLLKRTGFVLCSDVVGSNCGVEECVTIATQQRLFPNTSRALLTRLPEVAWEQTFDDPQRQAWHEQKMTSKYERAQHQLDWMGLSGSVEHC